jgi:hypothetical protein
VVSQIREIEEARQKRLEQEPEARPHAMVRQLARVVGVGIETADMLVHEVLAIRSNVADILRLEQVRNRLPGGGERIRTSGPSGNESRSRPGTGPQ